MANELLMTFYPPVNANAANQFDNYDEKKFHAHYLLTVKDRRDIPD